MIDYLGKVKMNYDFYSGVDHYCDGDIEDTLLQLVQKENRSNYNKVIAEYHNWPIMYHLSEARANIVDWVDITKEDNVLEVGAGCGAVTWKLADKAGNVTSVDLSKKRSLINAYRNIDKDNLEIIVGNFEDIEITEKYNYATLIGVLEYSDSYLDKSENSYVAMLKRLKKNLNKNGKILLAIENRFGLKYWAGCKEDHFGTYFSGIEGYPKESGIKTFTKKELKEIIEAAGYNSYKFYYPYPDYKFMTSLYSDEYLPQKNELVNNNRNFDLDRFELFNEANVFNSLLSNEMFPEFSNSFMVVIENGDNNE